MCLFKIASQLTNWIHNVIRQHTKFQNDFLEKKRSWHFILSIYWCAVRLVKMYRIMVFWLPPEIWPSWFRIENGLCQSKTSSHQFTLALKHVSAELIDRFIFLICKFREWSLLKIHRSCQWEVVNTVERSFYVTK